MGSQSLPTSAQSLQRSSSYCRQPQDQPVFTQLPLHPKWPKDLSNWPRVDHDDLKLIDLEETLQATVAKLDLARGFKVKIAQKLSDQTLDTCLDGINKIESEPTVEMLSRWHLNLDSDLSLQDFFEFFPFAAKVLDAIDKDTNFDDDEDNTFVAHVKSMDADQLAAFRALKSDAQWSLDYRWLPRQRKDTLLPPDSCDVEACWSPVDQKKLLSRPEQKPTDTDTGSKQKNDSTKDEVKDGASPPKCGWTASTLSCGRIMGGSRNPNIASDRDIT